MMLRIVTCFALLLVGTATARADEPPEKIGWGMGAKVRRSFVTPYIQKLFLDDTPGSATMDGGGIDFARRTGSTEVVFGFGYDRLEAKQGYYLEKGGDPLVPGKVDYVSFNHPNPAHWYTAEVTVTNHARIHKFLEFRYGAGLGIAVVRADIRKTDALCTGPKIQQDCMLDPMGVEVNKRADLPPVFPIVNALVGLQLRPFEFLHIHIDAGLHTVPYISVGAQLYLW